MTKDEMVKYVTDRLDKCQVILIMKNRRMCKYTYDKNTDGDRLLQLPDDLIDEDIHVINIGGRFPSYIENSIMQLVFEVKKMPDEIGWIYHGVTDISISEMKLNYDFDLGD